MQVGLDIGSTTIKIAVLDDAGKLLFAKYQRHYSQIAEKIQELLISKKFQLFFNLLPLRKVRVYPGPQVQLCQQATCCLRPYHCRGS